MSSQTKRTALWCLVIVNAVLLTVLIMRHAGSRAYAQQGRPSEYVMVPGEIPGVATGVVYVVDTINRQLSAMTYDSTNKQQPLVTMPKIDLNPIFNPGPAGAR